MKYLEAVMATNQINKNGTAIAEKALDDMAKQVCSSIGIPQLVDHDHARLAGWIRQAKVKKEGQEVKLVGLIEIPETNDEKTRLSILYADYKRHQRASITLPYQSALEKLDIDGCSLDYDNTLTLLSGERLLSHIFPELPQGYNSDGLFTISNDSFVGDGFISHGEYLLIPHRCFRASYTLPNV